MWAPDAEFHASRLITGRADLHAFAADKPNRMRRDGWYRMQHINSNLLVDGDGTVATGSCYLVLLAQSGPDDPPTITKFGMYRDELSKLAGEWVFTKRVVDFTFSAVTP